MKLKKPFLSFTLAFLAISGLFSPILAMEGTPEAPITAQNSGYLGYIPGGNWAYDETLGKRPGYTVGAVVGLFAAHYAYLKYKNWHNTRATIRRQLWEKIQSECYDFTVHGNSKHAQVRDITQPNIANALLKRKNDWLRDAKSIYNWGMFHDNRLVSLVNEFFDVLKNKSANVQTPIPAAAQKPWWQFWSTEKGERLLSDILNDIEECLMGSCG